MILRPSASHIWTKCHGQPRLAAKAFAEIESDAAREGTCAAWLAEMVLTGVIKDTFELNGQAHENGWLVDDAMCYHIQKYTELLDRIEGDLKVERKVTLTEEIKGTPDGYAVIKNHHLRVIDLKYGYMLIEPADNTQLTIYGGAILRKHPDIQTVSLEIFQPRAYHPDGFHRAHSLSADQLRGDVDKILAHAVEVRQPEATRTPGDHCTYCPAAGMCPQAATFNYAAYDRFMRAPETHLSADELSSELQFLELAEAVLDGRKRAIRAEAAERIRSNNEHIPGYMLDRPIGNRRFRSDVPKLMIEMMLGVNPTTDKMITPAEAEKRGADPDVIEQLVERPRGNARLKAIPKGYFSNMFPKIGE